MARSAPRNLHRQKVRGIECQQVEFSPVLPSHCRQAPEEKTLLCEGLRNPTAAIHPGDCMQRVLATVRQNAFGFFAFRAVPAGPGGPHRYQQAHLAGFQRARYQVLQDLHELVLCHLGVHVDAKAPVKILLGREHFSQSALVLLDRFALVGEGDFRVDDEWKIHDHEFTQDPGESSIGQVFHTDP